MNDLLLKKLNTLRMDCIAYSTEYTDQDILNEMEQTLSYLSASNGTISEGEVSFINEYLGTKLELSDLANFITANDTYSVRFETTVPKVFGIVAKDAKLGEEYLQTVDPLCREFIVSDEKAEESEVNDFNTYLNMLYDHYNSLHPGKNLSFTKAFAAQTQNYKYTGDEKEETLEDLLTELNDLIGLNSVKKNVYSLIHLQDIQAERERRGIPRIPMSNHLVFTGNPGTGKTTVARLIARIYKKIGVLTTGNFVEVDRSGLVAGYVGQTAIEVKSVVESAMGGVLFIDEAYALSNAGIANDYGHEAIETLLKQMEDNRENIVVIVAGYPDLMEQFINSNPGLKSRFSKKIFFPDYKPEELLEILHYMAKKNHCKISEDADRYAFEVLKKKYANRDSNFANAREVRNLFESAVVTQADRLFGQENLTDDQICTLEAEDFSFNEIMFSTGADIPFVKK